MRSDFTANLVAATSACTPPIPGCTHSAGDWKTKGPFKKNGDPGLNNIWPSSVMLNGLQLGSVQYLAPALNAILWEPGASNGLVSLAHELIAAKLNEANGADVSSIAQAIANADILIGALIVPPIGAGYIAAGNNPNNPTPVVMLTNALRLHNEGGPFGNCNN
jgi:hypothetical protein